jgi:multicomponent Na+:H+ antiporter subunit G
VTVLDLASAAALVCGAAFYAAGTAGLLRFPDVYSRLHALTKADNLGLGFVAFGLVLRAGGVVVAAKILAVWLFVLVSTSVASHLLARAAHRAGVPVALPDGRAGRVGAERPAGTV